MRLALVGLTHPFRGGISHYTTLLCQALRRSHDVRFFALSRQYPRLLFPGLTQIDRSASPLAVDHEACLDSINPLTWVETFRRIRAFGPALILFSWWNPFFAPSFGTLAHLAWLFGRTPSCFLCHNAIPHERSRADRLLLRYAFASAAAFIAHSRKDRDDLRMLRPRSPVYLNPHPTYEAFAAETIPTEHASKSALGLTGKKVLLFFGFVREYKGLDILLQSMELLPAEERYHLLIVGEFYEGRAKYEKHLERLSRDGQLTLVDRYVPNEAVPGYFSASDLVMVPYLSATQSGVIQMAYGFLRPVVATAVGGIPEVVVDGRTGYLVPPGDAAAISRAVRRYFEQADHEAFRKSIEQEKHKYSWDRMVETIEEIAHRVRSG